MKVFYHCPDSFGLMNTTYVIFRSYTGSLKLSLILILCTILCNVNNDVCFDFQKTLMMVFTTENVQ